RWSGKKGDEPPGVFLISREFEKATVAKALEAVSTASGQNVVLDPRCEKQAALEVSARLLNVTAATAVEVLCEMAGLDAVRIKNTFCAPTGENAERLRKKHAQRPKAMPPTRPAAKP